MGFDLAACSRKLARECRGTRLCLFECAALWLGGRRHRLRGLGFLHQGGGLLLLLLQGLSQFRGGGLRRLLLLRGFIDSLLRLRSLGLDLAACSRKLARECCGTRLCLFECAALWLGGRRHRLRGLGFLHQGGGLLLLLLQGLSQFSGSGLRRLLLLHGFIDSLLRLRGLGFDLAACSRKLARECRGTRLCLFECAALWLGGRRLCLCGLGFLHQGGGLLLLLLQGLSQFRGGALRRLLLLRGFIDSLLRLRGLGLGLAPCRCQFARQRGAARTFLVDRLTVLLAARGQLLSHIGGLPRESGRFLALFFERSRALRCFRLLELPCSVACLQQRLKVASQSDAARALLLKCLTLLLRARGQLLWPGGGLPRGDGYPLLILFDRLRGIRNLRQ